MGREDRDRTTVLVIGGMHSAACVNRVEQALRSCAGVESAGVNLLTRLATVRHAESVAPRQLLDAAAAAGYQASLACPAPDRKASLSFGDTMDAIASRKSRFVVGAILTVLILLVNELLATDSKLLPLFLLATPVQICVGWDYYRGFLRALARRALTMDSLVVLGSSAAYLQGCMCFVGYVSHDKDLLAEPQFHAAAMILTVVSLGKWLESRARESTRQLWGSLVELTPRQACVLRDGREQTIPSGVVAVGDIVLVRPGERIPVDGEVLEGVTDVDEAPITGESRPISKAKGDRVIAASVNGPGFIRVRAAGVGADSTIARISRMVSDAQERKARVEQLADRVSGKLVLLTAAVAAAAFSFWYFGPAAAQKLIASGWVSRAWIADSWLACLLHGYTLSEALRPAIAVLVVACPCALGLATPTAVIVATGLGARRGILIKGGEAIEAAARISDVLLSDRAVAGAGANAAQAVAAMHALGLRAHLLSGENPRATEAAGRACGLNPERIHALMGPEDKADFARRLKSAGACVAAVGDGINHAPALAAADVGFALGVGTNIAVESGQIVLVSPDVRGVPRAILLARRAQRTIRWNLVWALAFNAVMIPLAFFNLVVPALGAAVMAASSIIVVLNSLRLTYARIDEPPPAGTSGRLTLASPALAEPAK